MILYATGTPWLDLFIYLLLSSFAIIYAIRFQAQTCMKIRKWKTIIIATLAYLLCKWNARKMQATLWPIIVSKFWRHYCCRGRVHRVPVRGSLCRWLYVEKWARVWNWNEHRTRSCEWLTEWQPDDLDLSVFQCRRLGQFHHLHSATLGRLRRFSVTSTAAPRGPVSICRQLPFDSAVGAAGRH